MFKIGRFELTRIQDLVVEETESLFPNWDPSVRDTGGEALSGDYYDAATGIFKASMHSWLVRAPGLTMLIDTAAGNGKPRPASPRFDSLQTGYLADLAHAGVRPEDVDYVILTHLHVDHIGWNTVAAADGWAPTFLNARYLMVKGEYDWRDPQQGARERPVATHQPFIDSITPLMAAGRIDFVEGNETDFLPGVSFLPIPGHTRDQMAVQLRDGNAGALFAADSLHQPIQVLRPEWNSKYCEDGATAIATRRKVLELAADNNLLLMPSHFGGSGAAHVARDGAGFSFRPAV